LRSDNYQAALLSATGLSEIEPELAALQLMPLVFQTWDEVDFVREKLRSRLEERLLAKGFVVLFWADMGWVNFFTTKKITTPAELRRLKLFAWAGDNKQVQIMKSLGYQPVPLETDYILASFSSGMVDAAPVPPAFALGTQVQNLAGHVLEVNWAPIVGAAVIRKAVWDRIPPEWQPVLQSHCETAGRDIRREGRRFHDDSLNTLRKGPKTQVHSPTPDEQKQWDQLADELAPKIRGNLVPATIYDEVQRLLKEYRADRRKASSPKG
jgi:TRAP-type C4-dicarboxylate transport system substrate-binding protein